MIDCFEEKYRGLPHHHGGEGAESPEEMKRELDSLNQEINDSMEEESKLRNPENRLH